MEPGQHSNLQETRILLMLDANCCGESLATGIVWSRICPLRDGDAPEKIRDLMIGNCRNAGTAPSIAVLPKLCCGFWVP